MRVAAVRIHNYRSIRDLTFQVEPLMVLLGPNNHGKSNILRAIEFHLTPSAKPAQWDLYAHRDRGDDELWVELSFTDLTEQEENTFRKYICSGEKLTVRKSARLSESGWTISYAGYIEQPAEWWLRDDAYGRLKTRELVQSEVKAVPQLQPLLQRSGRITKDIITDFQQNYIAQHRDELNLMRRLETGPFMGQKNVAAGLLPEFYLVPAVRDLGDETRIASTTTFGRLVRRAVSEMLSTGTRLADLQDHINRAITQLETPADGERSVADLARVISEELRWWNVDVRLRIEPPAVQSLVEESVRLDLDDGLSTPAEEKGHGLQRATIFALLRTWAKTLREDRVREQEEFTPRKASESAIFAIEEPELFLHPQAQRQLARALAEITDSPGHQVFVCTHSPHFTSLERYRSLAVVTKPSPEIGTTVRQCRDELFGGEGESDRKRRFQMAAWINPDRGELFFAKRVILVEGATEKAALPYLAERLGCSDHDVSVIDCGSKFNLSLYVRICNAFRIPYSVVYDEDPLPDPVPADWTEDRLREANHAFAENERIAQSIDNSIGQAIVIRPDFGRALGVSRSSEDKKGKPLATLDHLESMSLEEVPAAIRDAVVRAYCAERQTRRAEREDTR